MSIVVDATVLIAALADAGNDGTWAESIIANNDLIAPELVLVETTNLLRRMEREREVSRMEATSAQRDLMRLDVGLFPFHPFAERIWDLRGNLTSNDAWYVALAERVNCPLATLDRRLTRATGPTCKFVLPE